MPSNFRMIMPTKSSFCFCCGRFFISLFLGAVLLLPVLLRANLPPSAYEAMQQAAAEALHIEVLRVETEPGTQLDEEVIRLTAVVTQVERSASGLQAGDSIQIVYTLKMGADGHPQPGQPPALEEGFSGPAFLRREPDRPIYHPAALALSFDLF